ncbi:MAG: lipoyl(octanoyl) transferase LipB [Gammaproteobacteria bacterium]|nr:lipoyl(octanoyl) transferase LipB [Gammaproteobacteria bacterium]
MSRPVILRNLGRVDFEPTWRQMQAFTEQRSAETPDEIWALEHPPVFTLGLNGDPAHVLAAGDVPVVATDRGGQVTYHGPGQLVVYPLLDLRRLKLGIRDLVTALEESVVMLLADWGIEAAPRPDAPGVYVAGEKIASIGLRVRRGSSYHGIAINVDLDLAPFGCINPCGYRDLAMTRIATLRPGARVESVRPVYLAALLRRLGLEAAPAPSRREAAASRAGVPTSDHSPR